MPEMLGPYEIGRVHQADALEALRLLPDGCVDAIITDPPYSSGGMFRGDRAKQTSTKYASCPRAEFMGDNKDQRLFMHWSAEWMTGALRTTADGGLLLCFTDWRQLPATTDAVQWAGWVWQGIIPWDKGDAVRPRPGGFRSGSEFVVWATHGPLPKREWYGGGVLRHPAPHDRDHITEKPVGLMVDLVRAVEAGGVVLDPFSGNATTGAACIREDRRFLGFELDPHWVEAGNARLDRERVARGMVVADTAKPGQQVGLLPGTG